MIATILSFEKMYKLFRNFDELRPINIYIGGGGGDYLKHS